MKKTILVLSLLFSLMGILRSFFFVFYDFEDVTEFLNLAVFSSQPYSFAGMEIYIPRHSIHGNSANSNVSMGLLNLSFFLTFLSGTFIYYFSKYKQTKLLIFNYSLIFLDSTIKIFSAILFFKINKLDIYSAIYIILALCYIYISYRFITKDLNTRETNIVNNENETIDDNLENVSNYKRFLNLLIDTSLIFIVCYGFILYADRNDNPVTLFGSFKSAFGDKFGSLIFFCMIKFIYYITFESIFQSTPAKFLTGCYVSDEDGNSPTFSMILKRTLCRFIPFESFSFFPGINMHDNYSCTVVVTNKRELKNENRYLFLLSMSFIIILFFYFYNISQNPY